MKKAKIIVAALMLLALTLSFAACNFGHIADTNGDDDFTVETIDDDEILTRTKYVAWLAKSSNNNGQYSVTVKKLSGVWQIADLSMKGYGAAVLKTDMTVESGNCRLVLVHNDKIVHDFNIQGQDSYVVTTSGNYYLKLVGESAHVSKLNFSWQLA